MNFIIAGLGKLDAYLFYKLNKLGHKSLLFKISFILSKSADGFWYFLTVPFLLFDHNSGVQLIKSLAVSYVIYFPIYYGLKNNLKRPRPFQKLEDINNLIAVPDKFSFPSGHTACAFIFSVIISSFHNELALYLYTWSTLVGLGRVSLGVHYPSDVLAGAIIGTLCAYIGLGI